jgi:hypothetical protein
VRASRIHPLSDSHTVGGPTQAELPWRVEVVPVNQLRPPVRTARTHPKAQIQRIANSIEKFGMIAPVVVDGRSKVVAGVGRLAAAKLLGLKSIPTIRVTHLSEAELRAYALADNRLTEDAGWDRSLLAVELKELEVELPSFGLDLDATGFLPGEIDALMLDFAEGNAAEDAIEEIKRDAVVSALGDLFVLGDHRLVVGDAQDPQVFERLMAGNLAQMAFLDPPYNVPIQGHVGGRGRIKHREFALASGELTSEQFTKFLTSTLGCCAKYSQEGSIHFVCMDWRHMRELQDAGAAIFSSLLNLIVWIKNNAGQGAFYRNQHELVFVFKKGGAPHLNTFGMGENGRNRSNVWRYPGLNAFRAGRLDELRMHPTTKPLAMVVDAMRDCSRRGAVILDAFAGSGTTIMAAEQIGRRAFCIEIDPAYVDAAIRRWQRHTWRDAILEATGETFAQISVSRSKSPGSE